MLEFLANPPWWVLIIVSVVLAKRWDRIEHYISSTSRFLMSHTKGKLRGFWRQKKRKKMLAIKATRTDHLEITKITVKSYTYLILFILFMVACGLLLAAASVMGNPARSQLLFSSLVAAAPGLICEILWLTTSTKVETYIKFNRAVRLKAKSLARKQHTLEIGESQSAPPTAKKLLSKQARPLGIDQDEWIARRTAEMAKQTNGFPSKEQS